MISHVGIGPPPRQKPPLPEYLADLAGRAHKVNSSLPVPIWRGDVAEINLVSSDIDASDSFSLEFENNCDAKFDESMLLLDASSALVPPHKQEGWILTSLPHFPLLLKVEALCRPTRRPLYLPAES